MAEPVLEAIARSYRGGCGVPRRGRDGCPGRAGGAGAGRRRLARRTARRRRHRGDGACRVPARPACGPARRRAGRRLRRPRPRHRGGGGGGRRSGGEPIWVPGDARWRESRCVRPPAALRRRRTQPGGRPAEEVTNDDRVSAPRALRTLPRRHRVPRGGRPRRAGGAGRAGVRFNGPGEVRLAANSEETTYVVFPPAPNASVPDGALDGVAGGAQRGVDWDVISPGDGVRRRAQPAPWWSGLHGGIAES